MTSPRIAAIMLAAGQSRRMGVNKLLLEIDGARLIERAVDAALGSVARPVIVVLGHEADLIRDRLADRPVISVENPDYALGLSTSLKTGLAAVPAEADGAIICLGDMPGIDPDLINRLIAGFDPARRRVIVAPVHQGRRGNPVLWGRDFFPALRDITGDTGARELLAAHRSFMAEIPVDGDAALIDLDTPSEVSRWRERQRK
jgi:molybdenum cofactor cytidylyltransferase